MRLLKPSFMLINPPAAQDLYRSIEQAGRVCYKSEDRITEDSGEKFCRMLIKRGHEAVLEHETLRVHFTINRGVSHELVRHRLGAICQESTRFCIYEDGVQFIIPDWVQMEPGEYTSYIQAAKAAGNFTSRLWALALKAGEGTYLTLLKHGWKAQEAREVLTNALKTEVIMTNNIRQWRHIFRLRTAEAAHPSMREVMRPLLAGVKQLYPALFEDI